MGTWAVPNLVGARDFARERFGWVTSKRVDEAIRRVRGIKSPTKSPTKPTKEPVQVKTSSKKAKNSGVRKERKKKGAEIEELIDREKTEGSLNCSLETNSQESASDVSLIAKSCGFVLNASKDDIIHSKSMQKQEEERKAKEAKDKAIEIFNKSKKSRKEMLKKKFKRPKRIEKKGHGLSESDSD